MLSEIAGPILLICFLLAFFITFVILYTVSIVESTKEEMYKKIDKLETEMYTIFT